MVVRVFFPSHDPAFDYLGQDREFGAMPRAGEEVRIISSGEVYRVDRAGHIEDGPRFIPSIWVSPITD